MIWQILFVLGVLLQCIAVNSGPPWFTRVAWVFWAIAAILWLVAPTAGLGAHHPLL